jgi:hypothetical protein
MADWRSQTETRIDSMAISVNIINIVAFRLSDMNCIKTVSATAKKAKKPEKI